MKTITAPAPNEIVLNGSGLVNCSLVAENLTAQLEGSGNVIRR